MPLAEHRLRRYRSPAQRKVDAARHRYVVEGPDFVPCKALGGLLKLDTPTAWSPCTIYDAAGRPVAVIPAGTRQRRPL